jgi:hypothetical protein
MVISLPFLDPTLDHIPRYLRYNLYLARMGLFVQGRRSPGDTSTLKKKRGAKTVLALILFLQNVRSSCMEATLHQ